MKKRLKTTGKLAIGVSILFLLAIYLFFFARATVIANYNYPKDSDADQNTLIELEQALFQEDNVLKSGQISYGVFDAESLTIPVTVSLFPSSFVETGESAVLHCNGQTISMSKEQEAFVATYTAPVFQPQTITDIAFIDEETALTLELNYTFEPAREIAPEFYRNVISNMTYKDEDKISYRQKLYVNLSYFPPQASTIKELRWLTLHDGIMQTNSDIQFVLRNPLDTIVPTPLYRAPSLVKTFRGSISSDQQIDFILEAVDDYGLRYQHLVSRLLFINMDDILDTTEETRIYDEDGNLLYVFEYSTSETGTPLMNGQPIHNY